MFEVFLGSVIYQEAADYLHDFFRSLEEQTFQQYHILLLNDNMKHQDLQNLLERHLLLKDKVRIVHTNSKYKPYELRVHLLMEAKRNNADLLVLGDCDDRFSANRIKEIVDAYDEKYTFFYHDLYDWNEKCIIQNMPEVVKDFRLIGEKNFLGFSTTALNMKKLGQEFIESLFDGKTNVFDWYVYSRILLSGGAGRYVHRAKTFYRIHDNNIAGLCGSDIDSIQKEIAVKLQHYDLLQEHHDYYKKLLQEYQAIQKNHEYETYKNNFKYGCWWENLDMSKAKGV